jgi:hypothetical protein
MLELALDEARAAAGAVVHGRVLADSPAPVVLELVRIEHSPSGVATYHVARALSEPDGGFALPVPDDAPPDVEGRACSLHYALRALADGEEVRERLRVCA